VNSLVGSSEQDIMRMGTGTSELHPHSVEEPFL
jgi:hypothetical protein